MTVLAVPLLVLTTFAQTPAPATSSHAPSPQWRRDGSARLRGSAIDFYQATFALGQEETPASPARANVTIGRQLTDYVGNRALITTETRNQPAPSQVPPGDRGQHRAHGNQRRAGAGHPGQVAAVERFIRRTPERLLITALDNPPPCAHSVRRWRDEPLDGIRYARASIRSISTSIAARDCSS